MNFLICKMANKVKKITNRVLLYINLLVAIVFLLSSLAPYRNPAKGELIAYLGFGFPFLLILTILFVFYWVILRSRYWLISLVALIGGIKSILLFFAFNLPGSFKHKKEPGALRVVSWNVERFVDQKQNNIIWEKEKMVIQLKEQNADVLCLQEFFYSLNPSHYQNLMEIRNKLNYPYWHFVPFDVDGDTHYEGSIIFSRYPIIDSGLLHFPPPSMQEALIWADIKLNNDTIRIYNTRMQSFLFAPEDHAAVDKIKNTPSGIFNKSHSILSKLKAGFVLRNIQANTVNQTLSLCHHPIIFCVDMNDVPNSNAYSLVKNNMQDAFLKEGFGIGRTYSSISPTLRIDYIFASKQFSVRQFDRVVNNYSDHYMLVADLKLKFTAEMRE